ncbi:ArsC family reductase [Aurantivibrio infirmus]
MTTLYGIPNCDTVKKARNWLNSKEIPYKFHDFRADGLAKSQVKTWIAAIGLEKLINKRSTTWKNLSSKQQNMLDEKSAIELILENPTLIKRPLIETPKDTLVGFKEKEYLALFS